MNPVTLSNATFDPAVADGEFDALSVQKEEDDFCVIEQVFHLATLQNHFLH